MLGQPHTTKLKSLTFAVGLFSACCASAGGTPVEMIKDEMQRKKNLVFAKYL